jgi:hypothetical protein
MILNKWQSQLFILPVRSIPHSHQTIAFMISCWYLLAFFWKLLQSTADSVSSIIKDRKYQAFLATSQYPSKLFHIK